MHFFVCVYMHLISPFKMFDVLFLWTPEIPDIVAGELVKTLVMSSSKVGLMNQTPSFYGL